MKGISFALFACSSLVFAVKGFFNAKDAKCFAKSAKKFSILD